MQRALLTIAGGLALWGASTVAHADPSPAEIAAARELFSQARAAENAGDYAGALRKLEAVAAVKRTPQVRFHLGLCEEQLGKLVEALNQFEQSKIEASQQGVPDVVEEAASHAEALRQRLPRVRIVLPPGVSDPQVAVDGQPLSALLLIHPVPIDPGEHRISVRTASGSFDKQITTREAEETRVEVELAVVAPKPTASSLPVTSSSSSPPSEHQSIAPWIVAGSGLAVTALGVGSLLLWSSAMRDIDAGCPAHTGCDPSLEDTRSRARTFGTLGPVLTGVGALGLGAGVYWIVSRSKHPAGELPAGAARIGPGPSVDLILRY